MSKQDDELAGTEIEDEDPVIGEEEEKEQAGEDEGDEDVESGDGKGDGEGKDKDQPPAGYAALVEEFGEEDANKFYAEKLGVKEEEPGGDAEPDEEDEWAFDQMQTDIEDQVETAQSEIADLTHRANTISNDYRFDQAELEKLVQQRRTINERIETADEISVEENRRLHAQTERLTEQIGELKASQNQRRVNYDSLINQGKDAERRKTELDAKSKAIKNVGRNAAKYPILKANRIIYARLVADGKIARNAKLSEVVSAISAERVKAGGKPIVTTKKATGADGRGSGGGKQTEKVRESWAKFNKRLKAPASMSGGGGGTVRPSAGKIAKKSKEDPFERQIPGLAEAHALQDEALAIMTGKNKGGKK